jgi:hypothetical protein
MYSRKKYDIYKLLILYWAQSPHSKGANLLYRHVIQKPETEPRQDTPTKEEAIVSIQTKETFKYLDGFQPPHLMSTHQSSSSSGSSSSSEEDDHQPIIDTTTSTPSEKEVCPRIMQGNRFLIFINRYFHY